MKLKITAIAAGLLVLSGGAGAAEMLQVDQMDTVTAGGWHRVDHNFGQRNSGMRGHDGRGFKWEIGKFKHRGQDYSARCKRPDGRYEYGQVKSEYQPDRGGSKNHNDAQPSTPPTNGAVGNIFVNIDGNDNVVNIFLAQNSVIDSGNTVTYTPSAPAPKPSNYGKDNNYRTAAARYIR